MGATSGQGLTDAAASVTASVTRCSTRRDGERSSAAVADRYRPDPRATRCLRERCRMCCTRPVAAIPRPRARGRAHPPGLSFLSGVIRRAPRIAVRRRTTRRPCVRCRLTDIASPGRHRPAHEPRRSQRDLARRDLADKLGGHRHRPDAGVATRIRARRSRCRNLAPPARGTHDRRTRDACLRTGSQAWPTHTGVGVDTGRFPIRVVWRIGQPSGDRMVGLPAAYAPAGLSLRRGRGPLRLLLAGALGDRRIRWLRQVRRGGCRAVPTALDR